MTDEEVQTQSNRAGLRASWSRTTVFESRLTVGRLLGAGEERRNELDFDVPPGSLPSNRATAYILHVAADIKGQVDPSTSAPIRVG